MDRIRGWWGAIIVCSLTLVSASAQTSLSAIPRQINLAAPAGSAIPARQTVTLVSGLQPVSFSADVRYMGTTTGWLSVTPLSGSTPATLTVSADASQLKPGSYLGQVTFTAPSLGAYVDVLFTVGSGQSSGGLIVNPSGLTFLSQANADVLPSQTLTLTTSGGSSGFTAYATSAGNWLNVWPPSGTAPGTLTVSVIASNLVAGTYTGTVTITPASGGNPIVVPVTLVASGTAAVPDSLTLSQTAVSFKYQLGASVPSLQSVRVTPSGAARQYTASSTATWLRLLSPLNQVPTSSLTDYAPGDFNIQVLPAGLSAGTYLGSVEVSSTGVAVQALPISLTIDPTPALNAYPSSFYFDDTVGTQASCIVANATGANLNVTVTAAASSPWLSVTPASASSASGAVVITVRADPAGLASGTYNGVVTLTDTDTNAVFSVPVQLKIKQTVVVNGPLDFTPESVDLAGRVGRPNPSQAVFIANRASASAQEFTAAASSQGGWLTVTPFRASVPLTTPVTLTITANSAAVPGPGTYTGSVLLTTLTTGKQDTIPVTFTLSQQAIAADPTGLSFVQDRRSATPPSQTVRVTANTTSTITVKDVPVWVRVSPMAALTPETLTVSVNPAGLAPGNVSGTFRIVGPNNQITVPVSLTVADFPVAAPAPTSLTFTYELGGAAPPTQPVVVGSTGDPIGFTVSTTSDTARGWLTVDPVSGTTPATINVGITAAQLLPGRYSGHVAFSTSDGSNQTRTVSIPVTLTVTAPKPAIQGILHGATLAPTPIAPGQLVTITGVGLGPASGLSGKLAAEGVYATKLGDIRLLFDGIPAPLMSVQLDRINAFVPYLLYGRASAKIQVEAFGASSAAIESRVVDAAPGLFTTGASGRDQAAALNADMSQNSALNPAARGSVIALFGTGEGQTDPPGQDGRVIASDLRRPILPVTARIAGRAATVTYFGSASGLVSGIFQANVRIPDDLEPGVVPVEIQVGGAITQAGVTVVVR